MLKLAQESRAKIGAEAGKISGMASEDINKPYWQRGLEVGSTVAAAAELPSLISGAKSLIQAGSKKIAEKKATQNVINQAVPKTGNFLSKINPFNIVGNKRVWQKRHWIHL